ncbi:MAG: acyl-CoA dehydrogenase family protein [Pseudomonadota bacterium]
MAIDVIDLPTPDWLADESVSVFADAVQKFFDRECTPHIDTWEAKGEVHRDLWTTAGSAGLLCAAVSDEFGGAGGDFRHEAIILEALGHYGAEAWGVSLHNGIVAPYIERYGTKEQKERWLLKLASGEYVGAIAMTEPGTGSDLQGIRTNAVRQSNKYILNGSKTFITNGQQADLIIVATKTEKDLGAKGVSLLIVEVPETEGFRRGRNLDKIGLKGQDTSELFFDDAAVPVDNLLGGEEGLGFYQLMQELPQERLIAAIVGVATMERALDETTRYVKERKAFGKPVFAFQNTQFKLAECKTKVTIAKTFVRSCLKRLLDGNLDAATASMAKYWITDTQCEVIDECLQLFGGYGYMNEYPIARLYRDARVQRIYGGTNEIMKLLIARTL